jgi:hypothetical protein
LTLPSKLLPKKTNITQDTIAKETITRQTADITLWSYFGAASRLYA